VFVVLPIHNSVQFVWSIILRLAVSGFAITLFLKCVADGVGRAQHFIMQLEHVELEAESKRKAKEAQAQETIVAEPA